MAQFSFYCISWFVGNFNLVGLKNPLDPLWTTFDVRGSYVFKVDIWVWIVTILFGLLRSHSGRQSLDYYSRILFIFSVFFSISRSESSTWLIASIRGCFNNQRGYSSRAVFKLPLHEPSRELMDYIFEPWHYVHEKCFYLLQGVNFTCECKPKSTSNFNNYKKHFFYKIQRNFEYIIFYWFYI